MADMSIPLSIATQGSSLVNYFATDFMPHGQCYAWSPAILWTNVFSDAVIVLAYASIPVSLVKFVKQRQDLAYSWMFIMFSAFIFACGLTHFMGIVTTWVGAYGWAAMVKFATAAISIATAVMLWRLIPLALHLPSPSQLRALNMSLEQRVAERTRAAEQRAEELTKANSELRQFNAMSVGREQRIIELKQEINRLAADSGKQPPYDLSWLPSSLNK